MQNLNIWKQTYSNYKNHLTRWPEEFPIPDKSADTIVSTFINEYSPVHMCPWYILSDNGTEFKNSHMDQVLQQLGIDGIFSAPYYPQSNGKLEVFHKYLKPALKKLCEKDPTNLDKYLNQALASYKITPILVTAESPFFWYMAETLTCHYINFWNSCNVFLEILVLVC